MDRPWAAGIQRVFEEAGSKKEGLPQGEARKRLAQNGLNLPGKAT